MELNYSKPVLAIQHATNLLETVAYVPAAPLNLTKIRPDFVHFRIQCVLRTK